MKTEASRGVGIDELVAEIENHRSHLFASGRIAAFLQEKNAVIFSEMLKERLFAAVSKRLADSGRFSEVVAGMCSREIDPYSAVDSILTESLNCPPPSGIQG
jgi:LAO/AO transport system kinase